MVTFKEKYEIWKKESADNQSYIKSLSKLLPIFKNEKVYFKGGFHEEISLLKQNSNEETWCWFWVQGEPGEKKWWNLVVPRKDKLRFRKKERKTGEVEEIVFRTCPQEWFVCHEKKSDKHNQAETSKAKQTWECLQTHKALNWLSSAILGVVLKFLTWCPAKRK